jgi:excisionase family DNA binding protein
VTNPSKEYLMPKEAAALLNCSLRTLERWRNTGYGPPFIKTGRKILYPLASLEEWRKAKSYRSTSEYPGGPHSVGFFLGLRPR